MFGRNFYDIVYLLMINVIININDLIWYTYYDIDEVLVSFNYEDETS